MDELVGLLVLLGLVALAVPVLLIVVLVSQAGLRRRVAGLEAALAALQAAGMPPHAPAAAEEGPTLGELVRARTAPPAAPAAAASDSPAVSPAVSPIVPPVVPPVVPPTPAAPETLPPGGPTSPVAASAPPPMPPAAPVDAAAPAAPARAKAPSPSVSAAAPSAPAPARPAYVPPRPPEENPLVRMVKRWFTVGNVPVKIGVLVLLAGVAALLKYASDQGIFVLPMELRLAGVAAGALAALAFAWRRRQSNRVFALSLQGGAIGVLLLVVFAATKLFGMIDAGPAFALSVLLVAGMGLLAVLQDAKALAVFALLAGFLAPIWLSTGSGSHVALFSYYALLNAAIVGIAWFRSWRILNLLGFAFTFGIGAMWGVGGGYLPEKYASTQPFLVLFFLFYLVVPILFARRQPAGRRDLVDGCLVFGTPLVAFSMQAGLTSGVVPDGERMPLALCALGMGVLYAGLAWTLLRRAGYAVLGQSYAILAVGFATLAVPLALSARATASVFALEGAGLVWLGLRQQRLLPMLTGTVLQLMAAMGCLIGLDAAPLDVQAVLNPTAMSLLLLAVGGLASAWAARAHGYRAPAAAFYAWGLMWWVVNVIHEVARFAASDVRADLLLVAAAATGWVAAELHRRRPAAALVLTVLGGLLVALPLLGWQEIAHAHPLGGRFGALAWGLFAVAGVRSLACLRQDTGVIANGTQFVWWLLWPLMLSLSGHWLGGHLGLGQGWRIALLAAPWLALAALALRRWNLLALPRAGEALAGMRQPLLFVVFAVIGTGWMLVLASAAPSAPLPWLPLLNPAELVQLLALALLAAWLWADDAPAPLVPLRTGMLALAGFVLLSVTTLRGVHHWGGIDWNGALAGSSLAQTSLTVVWSVLGVIGWVVGSRRGRRGLWLAGALLMGLVLLKLVFVDRSHLGNLTGIVSFMAYGVLCTIVGYLAPAPPRTPAATAESHA